MYRPDGTPLPHENHVHGHRVEGKTKASAGAVRPWRSSRWNADTVQLRFLRSSRDATAGCRRAELLVDISDVTARRSRSASPRLSNQETPSISKYPQMCIITSWNRSQSAFSRWGRESSAGADHDSDFPGRPGGGRRRDQKRTEGGQPRWHFETAVLAQGGGAGRYSQHLY